ncbi:hypothetical protein JHK82_040574 [Glycine max]|uniref:BZIP domain-containing protein n=1 Tax=Glycine soja TaxID=3848 RepID=A0A445H8B3_GLYSO|nr:basic leucine zipper 61-like [Glycine soja]KAG5111351.1 hypothetical protein JHK82_040574 [Glycine max]KAG4955002.1 hypothetical protein JHK87_040596 [Glycine soja]KAG5122639.1 hypothetical protein JHK84_040979 [Glycine max]KHN40099.1 hypothetical protein glysoja_009476 [Glycine soja]RZB69853.1 hypothetical protein D0Y65_039260 [Glycine soja]
MGDLKIRGDIVEEQLWPQKPTLIKPIPQRAQANVPIGVGPSFQQRQKPSKPLPKLATIPENDNLSTEENTTNEGGAAFVDANNQNISNEAQANTEQEMERKFRRTISNRFSARRSRLKKLAYMAELESKAKSFENTISLLREQIAAEQNEQKLLQIEHHTLKFQMAACEKQRIVLEAEFEKNKAEADRLCELQSRMNA